MTYPIFVLEGPDCGGKTTLAEVLAKKCGAKRLHATYRFKGRMHLYHLAQFRLALKTAQTRPVVMDRWWPSEIAYGNTYRSGPEPNFDYEFFIELGRCYCVSYTFCMPTRWEEYWKWYQLRYSKDREMYPLDMGQVNWLWQNYRELMLDHHKYYPQNLLQFYNITLEMPRQDGGNSFAKYILARMRTQLTYLKDEDKQTMRNMSKNWKTVGKHIHDERNNETLVGSTGTNNLSRYRSLEYTGNTGRLF